MISGMDKIEKMDLGAKPVESIEKNHNRKKLIFISLGIVVALFVVLAVAIIVPLKKTYSSPYFIRRYFPWLSGNLAEYHSNDNRHPVFNYWRYGPPDRGGRRFRGAKAN